MIDYNTLDIIIDSQGFPVSQYFHEEQQEFAVETTDGSVVLRSDVDFRLKTLILNKDGFPLPQLWDPELERFVPRTKSNVGSMKPVGAVSDERLTPFLSTRETSILPITSTSNTLRFGIIDGVISDENTVEYTTSTNNSYVGVTVVNHSILKKYIAYTEVSNTGTNPASNVSLQLGYSRTTNGSVESLGDALNSIGTLRPGEKSEATQVFTTSNLLGPNVILGVTTSTNGARLKIYQRIFDVTQLNEEEINSIDWKNPDTKQETTLRANYSDVAGTLEYNGSHWIGKNWLTLGDKITEVGVYQELVKTELGFGSFVNKGAGGLMVANMKDNVNNAEIIAADLITIYGSVNDFYTNGPVIGNLSDAPSKTGATFISKLKFLIESILTIKPTAKIVIIGTHNVADSYRPAIYQPVRDGKNIGDYVKAMGDVARHYGLGFIDVYGNCGFNAFNLNTYTTDGCHPNELGYKRISEVIVKELKTIHSIV